MQEAESCIGPYREATCCLIYLMVGARTDIAHYVCIFANFVKSSTTFDCVLLQTRVKIYPRRPGVLVQDMGD